MDVNEFIDQTIDVIQERGWCQHTLENSAGNVCLFGALYAATARQYGLPNLHAAAGRFYALQKNALEMIGKAIRIEVGESLSIPYYNDNNAKSAEDVILILKKAKVGE